MNWHLLQLILIPVIGIQTILEFLLRTVFKDGRTNKHKKLRVVLLCLTVATFATSKVADLIKDRERAIASERQTDKIVSKIGTEGSDIRTDVRNLTSDLITNEPTAAARLAIIARRETEVAKKSEAIKREIADMKGADLSVLREDLKNKREQEFLQKERSRILRAVADGAATQRNLQREKLMADKCIPAFDDVITKLYSMLLQVKNQTGSKLFFDFSSTPTIYSAKFLKDGMIVSATNSISLGTNEHWTFEISTENDEQSNLRVLRINCPGIRTIFGICPIFLDSGDQVNELQIHLGAYNTPTTIIDRREAYTNYTASVNEALRTLIAMQDEKFPLTILTNR